ncbi:MAG: FAD-dependent thymidylate synthase [Gemmatimonadota bacterium]
MERVEPKVFTVAMTMSSPAEMVRYLNHVGAPGWETDAPSDAEEVIEVMGRSCYKSFGTELNANIKKVREGNDEYVENILRVRHGSVLEHSSVSFMFCDVSRVFTHELCRHRAGVAISQESLRFVRLTDLRFWVPTVIAENEEARELVLRTVSHLEHVQQALGELLIDDDMPFSQKKTITSAMRRVAPIGLATNIGWTANFRTLRWVLEMRTHPSAEEEIRLVFGEVGRIVTEMFPNVFGDFDVIEEGGLPFYKPRNEKV